MFGMFLPDRTLCVVSTFRGLMKDLVYLFVCLFLFSDIDECKVDNGNCQEVCNNTLGSFICECGAGFTLQPDGLTCRGKAHA